MSAKPRFQVEGDANAPTCGKGYVPACAPGAPGAAAACTVAPAPTAAASPASAPASSSSSSTTAAASTASAANGTAAAAAKKTLSIEITTDPICPWCYVGHRRLEKALASLDKSQITVKKTVNPFFLDPTLPTKSVNKLEHYKAKFGASRVAQMLPHMKEVAKVEGINMSYGGKIGNTLNAHRLLQWAANKPASSAAGGKFATMQEHLLTVLYRRYFEEEQDMADLDTLVKAAEEVGLSNSRAFLESKELATEVQKEAYVNMNDHGITGVPFFVINGQYAVSGAQDPKFFINLFKRIGLPTVGV